MLFILGTFKKISNNSLKGNSPWSVFGKFWPTAELILKTLKQVIVVESQRHTHFSQFLSLDCVDRLFNIPESPHGTTCYSVLSLLSRKRKYKNEMIQWYRPILLTSLFTFLLISVEGSYSLQTKAENLLKFLKSTPTLTLILIWTIKLQNLRNCCAAKRSLTISPIKHILQCERRYYKYSPLQWQRIGVSLKVIPSKRLYLRGFERKKRLLRRLT